MNENRKIEKEQENKKHQKYKRIFFATFLLFILVFICACKNKYGNEEQKNIGLKPNLQSKEIIGKGKWYVLPAKMDRPRFSGSADLLPDGRVLILGNTSSENNSAQIFDPNTEKITTINPPIYNRAIGFATTPLKDGRIYISGGDLYNKNAWASEMTNTAEIYDPQTDKFTEVAKMNYLKVYHKAILLRNGHVLILHKANTGKFDEKSNLNKTLSYGELIKIKQEVYNPYTNTYYETKNILPFAVNNTVFKFDNGDLLFFADGKNYIYKLDKNEFIEAYNNISAGVNHLITQIDSNTILVVKGCSDNLKGDGGFIYNLKENKQIKTKNTTGATYCPGSRPRIVALKNKNVLITGMDRNLRTKKENKNIYKSYIYDYKSNEFKEISSPKYNVGTASIVQLQNGDILFAGGYKSNLIQVYKY